MTTTSPGAICRSRAGATISWFEPDHELAPLVRVDVDGGSELVAEREVRDERDTLRPGAPDDGTSTCRPEPFETCPPPVDELVVAVAEAVDPAPEILEVVLGREGFPGCRRRRRSGGDQDVLVVVLARELEHLEARPPEQSSQRPEAEVRTVLVVDVPEGHLVEHAVDVGELEQHDRLRTVADRPSDARHELGDVGDVLERVPTDHHVGVEMRVSVVVEVRDPFDPGGLGVVDPLGVHPGVDADAMARARLGHLDEELTLAAADLQDGPVAQVVVGAPTSWPARERTP
jgi:hypothetical protein